MPIYSPNQLGSGQYTPNVNSHLFFWWRKGEIILCSCLSCPIWPWKLLFTREKFKKEPKIKKYYWDNELWRWELLVWKLKGENGDWMFWKGIVSYVGWDLGGFGGLEIRWLEEEMEMVVGCVRGAMTLSVWGGMALSV